MKAIMQLEMRLVSVREQGELSSDLCEVHLMDNCSTLNLRALSVKRLGPFSLGERFLVSITPIVEEV